MTCSAWLYAFGAVALVLEDDLSSPFSHVVAAQKIYQLCTNSVAQEPSLIWLLLALGCSSSWTSQQRSQAEKQGPDVCHSGALETKMHVISSV